MKKVADILRANILIFFGALLFLLFLNLFAGNGYNIAEGVIAMLVATFSLVYGILNIVVGKGLKSNVKRIFDVILVCSYALLMFLFFLFGLIQDAQLNGYLGPTGWIIAIFSILASLALIGLYPVARFLNKKPLNNIAYLFAGIFCLALLLDILFAGSGAPIAIGNIVIVLVAVYVLFSIYLFGSLENGEALVKEEPKAIEQKEEEKPEEKAEEPAPEEEAE